MDQFEVCIKRCVYRNFHLDAMERPSIVCKNPSIIATEKLLWPVLKQLRNFRFSFHRWLSV